ncbi:MULTISPECIES: flagellar export protein FliJ [Paraliobacillus]|uniref:flagellar export protein FliJ n=1 Tax=Paraliobacillus TaxID=200903 RepID=UPI000DD4C20A|nr:MULTISPECIES: flagellar export protein FliJ [Paraliobacillus]
MTNIKAFQKILSHQERLKNEAQINYQEAMNNFETVATKLYQLLQKKEEVEKQYAYYLKSSGTVTTLATHYAYIDEIKKKIQQVELEVSKKRVIMEKKQVLLTQSHIEVKKFEIIIEKKNEKEKLREIYTENQQMDETSLRQFLANEDR